jgi:hypothetical protein
MHIILLFSMAVVVAGYSTGAGHCSTPSHGSKQSSAGASISAPTTATASSTVTVTLSGASFKGFILKASGGATFQSPPSGTKSKSCSGVSAVTHSSKAGKTSVSFTLQVCTIIDKSMAQ